MIYNSKVKIRKYSPPGKKSRAMMKCLALKKTSTTGRGFWRPLKALVVYPSSGSIFCCHCLIRPQIMEKAVDTGRDSTPVVSSCASTPATRLETGLGERRDTSLCWPSISRLSGVSAIKRSVSLESSFSIELSFRSFQSNKTDFPYEGLALG